ncbi:hypothetical protein [Streptomyces sp. NPDC003710]
MSRTSTASDRSTARRRWVNFRTARVDRTRGPDDQEQQHGGRAQGEDGECAEGLRRGRQVLVGDGREAGEDGAVEGEQ